MSAAPKLSMFDPDDDSTGPPPIRSDVATVAQILDWYLDTNRGKQDKMTEIERGRIYRLFIAACGKLRCTDARPHNLQTFLDAHVGDKSAWTIKRWNQMVQRAFNRATQLGVILANPFKGLTFPAGEEGRDWTKEEFGAVLRASAPYMRRFFIFMRFSGMRPGEVRDLLWTDIKREISCIILLKHKTVKKVKIPRRVPLNSVLTKLLEYQRSHVPMSATHVFLSAFGRPFTMRALNIGFWKMRRKAGLPKSLKIHGLRHTYCCGAIMAGLDVATLAQLVGHRDLKTTSRYIHLAGKSDHLNKAAEQAIRGNKGPAEEEKK